MTSSHNTIQVYSAVVCLIKVQMQSSTCSLRCQNPLPEWLRRHKPRVGAGYTRTRVHVILSVGSHLGQPVMTVVIHEKWAVDVVGE